MRSSAISSDRATFNPPAENLDEIEYCRGQLSAMAYASATSSREVHIIRLRSAFLRAGIVQKLRYSLGVLDLMREVQEVGGGYWIPTPVRVVPIDGQAILVGPASTREFQRHFSGVTRAGYARVLVQASVQGLPIQVLDDWLGLRIEESIAWSEAQIAEARSEMEPTIPSGNIQFFSIKTGQINSVLINTVVWTNDFRRSLTIPQGIVLCRERVVAERFRYFLGRLDGHRLVAEGLVPNDLARLQIGFAALAGQPFKVVIGSCNSESVIHVPVILPRPERQLISALGVRDLSAPGKAYRVRDNSFVSIIVARMRRLGCEVR